MVGGELVRGTDNAAGELGFLPFGADPFEAEPLRTGACERLVASAGIRARYTAVAAHRRSGFPRPSPAPPPARQRPSG